MSERSKVETRRRAAAPRMLFMGVGSSGAVAVDAMAKLDPTINAMAMDTDAKVLEGLGIEGIIHIGQAVTNGFSAGGDVELGRQSIERDSTGLRTQLRGMDLLVIVGGLGGGTGSGGIPVVARIAREAGCLVLCLLTTPFAFEGKDIVRKSDDALKRVRTHADAVVRLPNELLVPRSAADLPVDRAFARSRELLINGCFALNRLLAWRGVCGLDFACIQTMLRNCDGFCHFAHAEASGSARAAGIVCGLCEHPLLGGGKVLERGSGAIIAITGGHDLRLGEVDEIMAGLQGKLPEGVWLNYGVVLDPAFDKRLAVMALVAEQWKEPLVPDGQTSLRFDGKQAVLPLETVGKGRFADLDPTIHDNQDLDVPAYIRKNIKLPR